MGLVGYGSMPVTLEIPRLSCWHYSLSLSFSLTENDVDRNEVWREPRFDVRDSVSRERTFDVQEIADSLLQSSSVRSAPSWAHSWSSWPRQACTSRNFLFTSYGVFNFHLHRLIILDWQNLKSFSIVDFRKFQVAKILTTMMTKVTWIL